MMPTIRLDNRPDQERLFRALWDIGYRFGWRAKDVDAGWVVWVDAVHPAGRYPNMTVTKNGQMDAYGGSRIDFLSMNSIDQFVRYARRLKAAEPVPQPPAPQAIMPQPIISIPVVGTYGHWATPMTIYSTTVVTSTGGTGNDNW